MSESQKYMAKRLFEILKAMGAIKEEKRYASSSMECLPELFLEMKFRKNKEWIQSLTEAIGIFEGEEIAKDMARYERTRVLMTLSRNRNIPITSTLTNVALQAHVPIDKAKKILDQLMSEGLVESKKDYFYATRKGLMK